MSSFHLDQLAILTSLHGSPKSDLNSKTSQYKLFFINIMQ